MKKNLMISFITLLIFILNITDYVINTEAKEGLSDPVRDTEGNELRAGYRYLIRSVFPGGGVIAYPIFEENCTYAVVQQRFGDGFPVIFRPPGSDFGDVIPEFTGLNIMFPEGIVCGPSTVWKVDESATKFFVMTGGVAGNPGDETVNNLFQIEKVADGVYKLVFCPKFILINCRAVGIFYQDNARRLALSEFTFLVKFEKIYVGTTGTEHGWLQY